MNRLLRIWHYFVVVFVVIFLLVGLDSAAALSFGVRDQNRNDTSMTALMVKDIYTGTPSAFNTSNYDLTPLDGSLYFNASDGVRGAELWKSDGTPGGTLMVKDIELGEHGSNPGEITRLNDSLFFSARDSVHGTELWKSDGTEVGTALVRDIFTGTIGSIHYYGSGLSAMDEEVYFYANDGIHGYEPWKSDGTMTGTVMLKDVSPLEKSSYPETNPELMFSMDKSLYFVVQPSIFELELWNSDGTEAGTQFLRSFEHDYRAGYYVHEFTEYKGLLFFSANGGPTGQQELWKSDGTPGGTELVKKIVPGDDGSFPRNLTVVKDKLFFTADDNVHGTELWFSDGTANGTMMFKDIYTGSVGSSPANLTNIGGTLYFSADDGVHGSELWQSDGTLEGTVMVADIFSGMGDSSPSEIIEVDGVIYFKAADDVHGEELYLTDGRADGTKLVKDIRLGSDGANIMGLTNNGGQLYFIADNGLHGRELWTFMTVIYDHLTHLPAVFH
jgi:ELWxxDGT repeat protein